MKQTITIFWFRRDLRLEDNVGLYEALKGDDPVLPVFIFDSNILDHLPKNDARLTFLHDTLKDMRQVLEESHNSGIALYQGKPLEAFKQITSEYNVRSVYTNHDYEPYARERDEELRTFFSSKDIGFKSFKDQVIFEKEEVVKNDGDPYVVYTPYMRKWKETFTVDTLNSYDCATYFDNLINNKDLPNLSLSDLGFKRSSQKVQPYDVSPELIRNYEETRNFPALESTSRLGPHLRFGTVSIRKMMKKAIDEDNETFWQELIWREFFMQILWHFPHTKDRSFKAKYDRIQWRNDEEEFKKWCAGKTGYPLVDAGMRQLNETGFMHNRIRMLVGSFLCKHLLIDWRWGEAYFAEKLHDYEMASNVGNWQWVAGSGVDAAPYFRIFNPTTQIKKFDKNLEYIKKWAPDFQEPTYPDPIVEHKMARERCLETYKNALN
jgi:deoxyribodipyrimidine photo-lyase